MRDLDFEAIFERYHQALYRFCLSIVGNPEDAGEALQNTMVKALRTLPGEEREVQLKPWLYRVAHNESIDLLRRRRDRVELDAELAGSGGLAEEVEVRERLRTLIADLRELPERQRAALVMRELGGLEFGEIGAALDTAASTARQTVYEARLNLQQLKAGREMSCERVRWELSAEDGRVTRRRDIQAHLRNCADCRDFRDAIAIRQRDLAALAPLPAVASAGLLHAVLAGGQGGGLGGAVAAGVGKVATGSAALKSAATVAVVAAIAVPAADRAGLVDAGLFNRGTAKSQPAARASTAPDATGTNGSGGGVGNRPPGEGGSGNTGRQEEPAITRADAVKPGGKQGGTAATGAPSSGAAAPTGTSQEPPPASNHGQETAASHSGGRDSAHSHSKGHSPAHAKNAPAHGSPHPHEAGPPPGDEPPRKEHPPHPSSGQPSKVTPDGGNEKPLQPSEPPKAQDRPTGPGGHESKEAR